MPDSICCDFHLRCTGCEACAQSCPIACVSMERDDEGFPYPLIDKKRCVECGLCVRACPNNRSLYVGFFQQAWAFQERRGEALRSSSGGAFHALAVQVVEGGGVVYGFAFERGGAVAMRRAESVDELECLRGSKYVQGSMAGMYPRIARDVDEGVPVLVSGTGCQIAGVRSFVGKADNLLLIDVVCHGVPSPGLFERQWAFVEDRYGDSLVSYAFRDKRRAHWRLSKRFRYVFESRSNVVGNWKRDPFYNAYLKGGIMRESCYVCRYASEARCSDLTLCDYWGIGDRHPEIDACQGVSAVIATSSKGVEAALRLSDRGTLSRTELERVVRGNVNLRHPTERPCKRDYAYGAVREKGYAAWSKEQVGFRDKASSLAAELVPAGLADFVFKVLGRR